MDVPAAHTNRCRGGGGRDLDLAEASDALLLKSCLRRTGAGLLLFVSAVMGTYGSIIWYAIGLAHSPGSPGGEERNERSTEQRPDDEFGRSA